MKNRAYFLVGPTASGKSAVAQYLAERNGSLVVSADSMNLYTGMNIGTAKPSFAEQELVDYRGVNLALPSESFSVANYLERVQSAFNGDRKVIVAGGTGLYIKCLTEGFNEVPPANVALREKLEQLDFPTLQQQAQKKATNLYQSLTPDDQQNPRRLIRILERAGAPLPEATKQAAAGQWNSKPKPVIVGLKVEREVLCRRIEQRVDEMYAEGLLDEARILMQQDLSPTALQAIGYSEAFAVLAKTMSIDEAKERTLIRTRQLAKRQMTWFRNQLNIEWIDTYDYSGVKALAGAVSEAWNRTGPTPVCF